MPATSNIAVSRTDFLEKTPGGRCMRTLREVKSVLSTASASIEAALWATFNRRSKKHPLVRCDAVFTACYNERLRCSTGCDALHDLLHHSGLQRRRADRPDADGPA